jgi:hypothetical protein
MGEACFGAAFKKSMTPWGQFRFVRKPVIKQKVNDLFIGSFSGEFVNVIATIKKNPLFTPHVSDTGFSGNNSFKSTSGDRHNDLLVSGV